MRVYTINDAFKDGYVSVEEAKADATLNGWGRDLDFFSPDESADPDVWGEVEHCPDCDARVFWQPRSSRYAHFGPPCWLTHTQGHVVLCWPTEPWLNKTAVERRKMATSKR